MRHLATAIGGVEYGDRNDIKLKGFHRLDKREREGKLKTFFHILTRKYILGFKKVSLDFLACLLHRKKSLSTK